MKPIRTPIFSPCPCPMAGFLSPLIIWPLEEIKNTNNINDVTDSKRDI